MPIKLALLMILAPLFLAAQITPPPSTGGASAIPCVGTPGNTAGPAGSTCVVPVTGAVYACKATSPATCSVAGDWAVVSGSLSGGSSFGGNVTISGNGSIQ
jgi:hypothetical protein